MPRPPPDKDRLDRRLVGPRRHMPPTFQHRYLELISQIEANFRVPQWRCGDVDVWPADQCLRPGVVANDQVSEDYRSTMTYRHPSLCTCTARLTSLDNDRGDSVAGHCRVTHEEGVFLWWCLWPELG